MCGGNEQTNNDGDDDDDDDWVESFFGLLVQCQFWFQFSGMFPSFFSVFFGYFQQTTIRVAGVNSNKMFNKKIIRQLYTTNNNGSTAAHALTNNGFFFWQT